MFGAGAVGSPVDVATFAAVMATLYRVTKSQSAGHAATTALAEQVDGVAEDRVRADLDVEERHSDAYLLADGGQR